MLKMVCKDVQIEPYRTVQIVLSQEINGGVLTPGKKRAADARLDIHALTILFLMTTATCICLLFVALCAGIFVGQNITRFLSNFKITTSVRRNWINDFVPVWLFKWRLATTFPDAIRVFTLLIFHPSDFIIFQTRSLSTSTLKRGKSFFNLDPRCCCSFSLLNSPEDMRSSEAFSIFSKTVLFAVFFNASVSSL